MTSNGNMRTHDIAWNIVSSIIAQKAFQFVRQFWRRQVYHLSPEVKSYLIANLFPMP
jgi:hypothetical protein